MIEHVQLEGKDIYLLGTAHVSTESVQEVGEAIDEVKPDVVAVELCPQRYDALVNEKRWNNLEITDVIESGRIYLFLAQILLSNFQRKVGEDLDIKPGAEMLEAVNAAREKNVPVELVDRDIQVTLKRAADQLSLTEKLRLGYGFLENIFESQELDRQMVEDLKEKDMLTEIIQEMGETVPSLKRTLVDERDEYIAGKIHSLNADTVLAVVGAGHIEGIKKQLASMEGDININYSLNVGVAGCEHQPVQFTPEQKDREKTSKLKIIGYLVPAIFITLMAYSLITHGGELTLRLLAKWFLINGTLSAIGVSLAFAHPLTVLVAFLSAPFTSLNPAVAAGWVAGYVELKMHKPRVKDFDGLMNLKGLGDYTGNRVTKTVLVVALANIGSTVGTFIALPYIASLI